MNELILINENHFIILSVFASFSTSLISAIFGIGGGIILLSFFASVLPPLALIPVHAVVQLASNGGRVFLLKNEIHWPILSTFIFGCTIGAFFGGMIILQIPHELIKFFMGLFILWSIYGYLPKFNKKQIFFGSIISCTLSVIVGATGAFIAAIVNTFKLPKLNHIATVAFVMMTKHILKICVFTFLGFSFTPYINIIILMIIGGFLGTIIGKKIMYQINETFFRKLLNFVLTLLALRIIIISINDLNIFNI